MSKDLSGLRVYENGLCDEDELTFFGLAFGTHDRDVVPDDVAVEILLYEHYLLMK